MATNLERFLGSSPIAARAGMVARVVVRRFRSMPREIDARVRSGRFAVKGSPTCELVVGGVVLARGEITETDGGPAFRVTEVVE